MAVLLSRPSSAQDIKIYTNEIVKRSDLEFYVENANVGAIVRVHNVIGKVLKTYTIATAGDCVLIFSTDKIPKGRYIVSYSDSAENKSAKAFNVHD